MGSNPLNQQYSILKGGVTLSISKMLSLCGIAATDIYIYAYVHIHMYYY